MSVETQASVERIKLVYQSHINGNEQDIELPFRLLVLGNFSSDTSADIYEQQQPLAVTEHTFDTVLGNLAPQVQFSVVNTLYDHADTDADLIDVNLTFKHLQNFHPNPFVNNTVNQPIFEFATTITRVKRTNRCQRSMAKPTQ